MWPVKGDPPVKKDSSILYETREARKQLPTPTMFSERTNRAMEDSSTSNK
jgi:hypothetical protein